MKTITKIDNIKDLYSQIKQKTNYMIELATHLDKSPNSLRVHWFGNFWSIPSHHQDEVIIFTQKYIKNQK